MSDDKGPNLVAFVVVMGLCAILPVLSLIVQLGGCSVAGK
jgi:hypothetical protein